MHNVQVHDAVEAAMAAGGEKSLKEKEAEAGEEGGGTKRKGGGEGEIFLQTEMGLNDDIL